MNSTTKRESYPETELEVIPNVATLDQKSKLHIDETISDATIPGEMIMAEPPADEASSTSGEMPRTASTEIAEAWIQNAEQRRIMINRFRNLPTPIGFILMGVGVSGLVIPGMVGLPLFVAGGLILAPWTLGNMDDYLMKRFPNLYTSGLHAMDRFLTDLEKRYPDEP